MKKFLVKYFFPAMMIMGGGKFMTSCRGSSNQPTKQNIHLSFGADEMRDPNSPAFKDKIRGELANPLRDTVFLVPRVPVAGWENLCAATNYNVTNRMMEFMNLDPNRVWGKGTARFENITPSSQAQWKARRFHVERIQAAAAEQKFHNDLRAAQAQSVRVQ